MSTVLRVDDGVARLSIHRFPRATSVAPGDVETDGRFDTSHVVMSF